MIFIDMEMPQCCDKCPLYDNRWTYPTCYFTGISKKYNFNPFEKRMSDCPLKEVKIGKDLFPEKPNRNYKIYIPKPYYQKR